MTLAGVMRVIIVAGLFLSAPALGQSQPKPPPPPPAPAPPQPKPAPPPPAAGQPKTAAPTTGQSQAPTGGEAPPAGDKPDFKPEELEQLVAPIALYPDSLLSQVLMASTYPIEIVAADRWVKANPKLK